ncbi:MAG: hypothetical protein V1767_02180 [Chloroflexota bacterium]
MCPIDNRDWYRGKHPPSCTCSDCTDDRLKRLRKEAHPSYVTICPRCGKKSLFKDQQQGIYECLNLKCKAKGTAAEIYDRYMTPEETTLAASEAGHKTQEQARPHKSLRTVNTFLPWNWLRGLLLLFTLSIIGIAVSGLDPPPITVPVVTSLL